MDNDIFIPGGSVSPEESGHVDENIETSVPENAGHADENTDSEGEIQQQDEQPRLLCGKFKTEGELKKSFNNLARRIEAEKGLLPGTIKATADLEGDYDNLQSYYTMMRQQATQSQQTPKEEYSPEDEEAERVAVWYQQAVQINPVEASRQLMEYYAEKQMRQIKEELSPMTEDRQRMEDLNAVAGKYADFGQYADGLQEQLSDMALNEPELLNVPNWAEIAYMRAKISALESQGKTAFENGKKAAADERSGKKKISNETGNKANTEGNDIPEGITIIGAGDGIFL